MKLVLTFLLLNPFICTFGKIYKWVDEAGITHYSENKPDDIEPDEIKLKTEKNGTSIQLKEQDIAGHWLVDEGLFLPSSEGVTVIWEFKAGNWTVIKEGERHPGGTYELTGNIMDFGEMFFEVITLGNNTIKADSAGMIFTMKRK